MVSGLLGLARRALPCSAAALLLLLVLVLVPALSVRALAAGAPMPSLDAVIAHAQALELDADPRWRLLLHMPRQGGTSQVLTPEFFLADTGAGDARAELVATLRALWLPVPDDPDSHARCRFPARQIWLAAALELPALKAPDPRCRKIWQWLDLGQLKSASVVLVSGYFGNPASAFGHALLRFDAGQGERTDGLSDLSVNFGALVPQNENMLRYVASGLTGGYTAGFSDKDFIEHDQVYVRGENRDMWNYQLALDPWHLQLLALHVWEIAGKKFTYFFLSRNCAWRLAELLELVLPVELRRGADETWYIPVELFHRLELAESADHRSFRALRFQPSAQRVLITQLEALIPLEQAAFEQVLSTDALHIDAVLSGLPRREALRVLELVLSWASWKDPSGQPGDEHARVAVIKQRALSARLRLPTGSADLPLPSALPSPALGTSPTRYAAGLHQTADGKAALSLRWTAAAFELGGFHGMEAGELQVGDVRVEAGRRVRLESLAALSVRKLNTQAAGLPDEWDFAWQVKLGARRPPALGVLRVYARGGIGQAASLWHGRLQAYAFADAEILLQPAQLSLAPNAGLQWADGPWRAGLEWRYTAALPAPARRQLDLSVQRQLSLQTVLALGWRNDPASRVEVMLQYYP